MDVQKLLRYCVEKLVENPDAIVISHTSTPEKDIYEVRVAPGDLAKIIGREGRTFKALRALINIPAIDQINDLVVDTLAQ
jgi:uncharacterized protein